MPEAKILVFRRIGQKVIAEYENPRFVAANASADEQAAAHDAFAVSTVWAGKVEGMTPDGRVLVDLSGFLTRDVEDIAGDLQRSGERGFKIVPDLSVADPAAVKVFPLRLPGVRGPPDLRLRHAPGWRWQHRPRRQADHADHAPQPDPACPSRAMCCRYFDPRSGGFDSHRL